MHRLLQKTLGQESVIIFDLEDTLSDLDTNKARSLKIWGRSELMTFAQAHPNFFQNKRVGIRVNGLKSGEFEKDLKTVAAISQIWDLDYIMGPKIDSAEDVQEYLFWLKNNQVRYQRFVPIIETLEGINNLSLIVSDPSISDAAYGHYDYSLDSGHWPFSEQDEAQFWHLASLFIQQTEKANVRYIHPPLAFLCNQELSTQVFLLLQERCSLPFTIVTINSRQTAFFNHLMHTLAQLNAQELRSTSYSMQDKIDQALYIKEIGSMKDRNFGFDPKTGNFFSPHHYKAALQFLEKLK